MFPRITIGCALLVGCHDGNATAVDGAAGDSSHDTTPPRPTPQLGSSNQICKLLSDKNTSDPTANDVQHRSNVLGADLGIPVVHDNKLYILFGDTIGFANIWGAESHPDAVGYALDSADAVAADPSLLCTRLRIVSLPPPSSASGVDADFAGVAMAAPAGHQLAEYIHNPAGKTTRFPYLPGDFEVPSGAFSTSDGIYVFYTTVESQTDITMIGSYLAKWGQPKTTGPFAYDILYGIQQRGHFTNIAAETFGDYVYMFGTGDYRKSPIYLAKKRLDSLATTGFDEAAQPIVDIPGYGETSVRYFPTIDRWMMLAEESLPASNHIVARFADQPEGPWSAGIVVHDMGDIAFRNAYCCTPDNTCTGKQMFNCDKTGFYGTYLFPTVRGDANQFTVTYTMSSFDPYNVAIFETTFHL